MRGIHDGADAGARSLADLRPRPPQRHVQLPDRDGPERLQAVLDVTRDGQLDFCERFRDD